MATVALPTALNGQDFRMTLIDYSADRRPPLGGAVQRTARLGSRYVATLNLPPMTEVEARAWRGPISKARAEGAYVSMELPDEQPVGFGALLVNDAAQAGTTLLVDGGTPGATVPVGYLFNLTIAGKRQIYEVTAAAVLSGAGQAALSVSPMLRGSPANNAALDFKPSIEGLPGGTEHSYSMDGNRYVAMSITIEEPE